MRKKILAGNWKMNLTPAQALQLTAELANKPMDSKVQVIIAPSFVSIYPIFQFLQSSNISAIQLAAQNCYFENAGAFTGEIAINMLAEVGVQYVIVGHSERRSIFLENNELLLNKVKALLAQNLIPIFCCGEPLTNRTNNTQNEYVLKQLEDTLWMLNEQEILKVIIAYEPIWAIGTGHTATNQQANDMHHFIRQQIAQKFNQQVANQISILYGGSVNAVSAPALLAMPHIDGALVGGASLKPNDFFQIYQSF